MAERTITAKIEDDQIMIACDAFIIPNALKCLNSFLCESVREEFRKYLINYCADNAIALPGPTDVSRVVCAQIWFTGNDSVASDNLVDHGFWILDESGEEQFCEFDTSYVSFVPVRSILNLKEGESTILKVHGKYGSRKDMMHNKSTCKDIEIFLEITARQLSYRYQRFGTFEKCLEDLS